MLEHSIQGKHTASIQRFGRDHVPSEHMSIRAQRRPWRHRNPTIFPYRAYRGSLRVLRERRKQARDDDDDGLLVMRTGEAAEVLFPPSAAFQRLIVPMLEESREHKTESQAGHGGVQFHPSIPCLLG